MDPMLKLQIKGITAMTALLKAAGKEHQKALKTAFQVEGYRLRLKLKTEIKRGTPGGHPYAAGLREISSRTKKFGRKRKNQVPLYRLANLLRYKAGFEQGGPYLKFGFIKPKQARLVIEHAEGKDAQLSTERYDKLDNTLSAIGRLLAKKKDPTAKYFFLQKLAGKPFDLPARPIVEPFWVANKAEATRNILTNLRRKLAGQRI